MTGAAFTITETFGQTRRTMTFAAGPLELVNPDAATPLEQLGVSIRHVDTRWEWLGPKPPPPLDN